MLQYFVDSNPGELYSFTKNFALINLCSGHKSYRRINPAEAEAIKTDLKKGICRDRIISFSKASRLSVGPSQLSVYCVPAALCPGVKWPKRAAGYSPPPLSS